MSENGWIKLSDRLPDKWPVWVTDGSRIGWAKASYYNGAAHGDRPSVVGWSAYEDARATHWMRATFPPLPPPEKSDEERAFEKAVAIRIGQQDDNGYTIAGSDLRAIWDAAVQWQKGRK